MKSKAGQRPHLGSLQDFEKSLTAFCMAHEQQASMRTNHPKAARQWTRMYDAPIHAGKCMDAVIVHLLQVPVSALTTQKLWDPSRARRQPWGFQEGCNVISAQAGDSLRANNCVVQHAVLRQPDPLSSLCLQRTALQFGRRTPRGSRDCSRAPTQMVCSRTLCVTVSGTWADSKRLEVGLPFSKLTARGLCSQHRPHTQMQQRGWSSKSRDGTSMPDS